MQTYWNKAISYSAYKQLLTDLLAQGKTTGENQSPEMIDYARLNLQRMRRVEKTFALIPELQSLLTKTISIQYMLVLTEGWCGDAAQITPALAAIAQEFPNLEIRFLLRDENLELMDQFLTNGGRSIPMVLFLDQQFDVVEKWGPRPRTLQKMIDEMRQEGKLKFSEMVEKVHLWYAQDKSISTQSEIAELIRNL